MSLFEANNFPPPLSPSWFPTPLSSRVPSSFRYFMWSWATFLLSSKTASWTSENASKLSDASLANLTSKGHNYLYRFDLWSLGSTSICFPLISYTTPHRASLVHLFTIYFWGSNLTSRSFNILNAWQHNMSTHSNPSCNYKLLSHLKDQMSNYVLVYFHPWWSHNQTE